jgi:long-chain fatty acid transport protein
MRFALKYAALAAACMVTFPAHATNGYFLPGFGIRSQGMGGVGIAYGRDSLSTAANPANAVNTGMRGDMGFAVFNPERSAHDYDAPFATSPTFGFFNANVESDSKYFLVPEMGFSMGLSEELHISMAVVGNGGMNTNYPNNLFPGLGVPATPADLRIGIDMMQLLIPLTVAYKVNENHALGVSLVLAETRFRAYGIDTFKAFPILSDANYLTNNGFDYSYGAGIKLGWLGEFMDDKLTVGLTYASRTYMTKFDKYSSLFAEQGGFDIPESYGIGFAIKPVKNLVVAADVLRINYADIASVGNPGPGADPDGFGPKSGIPAMDFGVACPSAANPYCLGRDLGMGFGWDNMTVYKLGVQYGVNNRLQVRAGYNYGKSPIPDNQVTFNMLAPATVERHYSVGFTYRPNETLEVSGSYMYAAANSQSACGQNIVDCVEIGMHQNVFGLTMGWVLDPGPVALEEYGDGDWAGINFDGWYAGFGFGQSQYQDVESSLDEGFAAQGVTSSTTANNQTEGWKVYTGYQFNKYLGAEGGYANLNDMSANSTTSIGLVHTDLVSTAWMLAAVGTYPVTENFSVMGKLGAAYVLQTADVKVGSALTQRTGDDAYQPYYGVGVSYALVDNFKLRAEWERFDLDDINIDLMTAGFTVAF